MGRKQAVKVLNEKSQRSNIIDMIKGMGIVLMVLRHARAPYSDFVLLFHMPIFFIASGYLYNHNYANNIQGVKRYIWKKIKTLYIPYISYVSVFIILNNFFLKLDIYTINKEFLKQKVTQGYAILGHKYNVFENIINILKAAMFRGGTQLTGAAWFFQTLFMTLILYTVLEFFVEMVCDKEKAIRIQTIIAVCSLMLGWICQLKGWYIFIGLNRVFTAYSLIHLGVLIKYHSLMDRLLVRSKNGYLFCASFVILLCGYHRNFISLDENHIGNPIFFLIMSISGWVMLFSLADILEKSNLKIKILLCYISQHSVPIIMLHFLTFKIINCVAVYVYGLPKYMIASFPVLISSGVWWIFYTAVGLIVPLIMRKIGVEMMKCIRKLSDNTLINKNI